MTPSSYLPRHTPRRPLCLLGAACLALLLGTGCAGDLFGSRSEPAVTSYPSPVPADPRPAARSAALPTSAQTVQPAAPARDAISLPPVLPEPQGARIGLLLPLSGPAAPLGSGLLWAAELALFDAPEAGIVLMARDTRGTPEGAAAAATDLVAQGAELVIGPVFARSVEAASAVTRRGGVPMIAFSNDLSVAAPGVFLMGYPPDEQVERLIAFAAPRGVDRMAILAPQDAYGLAAADAADRAGRESGIDVVAGRWIANDARGQELANLVLAFAAELRSLEFRSRDAVLLPFPGERLLEIVPLLASAGVDADRMLLMGTESWEHPGLTREPALRGAVYAAPAPESRLHFRTRFREVFGEPPPRVATLAYDSIALAAALASQPPPASGRRFGRDTITAPQGFMGADGLFRFRPEGPTERSFAVLIVDEGGPRLIEPAAGRFGALPRAGF